MPTAGPGQPAARTPTTNFSNLRTHLKLPREGLATKRADRAAGLAGGHAGRLDPAASHRPVPTAGPGQPCPTFSNFKLRCLARAPCTTNEAVGGSHAAQKTGLGGPEMGPEIARERLRRAAGPPAAPAAGLHLSHCLARAPALRSGCGGLACSPEMRPAARRWAQKSLVSGGGPFGS